MCHAGLATPSVLSVHPPRVCEKSRYVQYIPPSPSQTVRARVRLYSLATARSVPSPTWPCTAISLGRLPAHASVSRADAQQPRAGRGIATAAARHGRTNTPSHSPPHQ